MRIRKAQAAALLGMMWLAVLFLFLGNTAATVTVCASGCNDTTVANAIATAGAGDTVQINDNSITNESVTINSNLAGIQGINNSITWISTGANPTIKINAGLTQPFFLKNLFIQHTTTSQNVLNWAALGVGSAVTIQNCHIYDSTTSSAVVIAVVLTTGNQLYCINDIFETTGSSPAFRVGALVTTTNDIFIANSRFLGATIGYDNDTSVDNNSLQQITNCDFISCATAYSSKAVGTNKNCLFLGSTTDLSLTSPASNSDFTFCSFGQLGSGPANSIFGITSAREFTSGTLLGESYLRPVAQSKGAGVSVNGVTNGTDLLGISWLGTPSIGCYEYVLPTGRGYGTR